MKISALAAVRKNVTHHLSSYVYIKDNDKIIIMMVRYGLIFIKRIRL